jgi:sortase (surface protein transpeptidase)
VLEFQPVPKKVICVTAMNLILLIFPEISNFLFKAEFEREEKKSDDKTEKLKRSEYNAEERMTGNKSKKKKKG